MSFRYMRLFVMFDLPVETSAQKRQYRRFRKFLIEKGFIMEQYSIYSKLVLNHSVASSYQKQLRANLPPQGNIQMLIITEKQYSDIIVLRGEKQTNIESSTERKVIL
ncbi:CRISPR-associated endonuclease Cas2 [Exiguobacterium algae]|uniref:CRISPR-associated endonuclease Cas2 n=1 Tax=Exiguobacterium algae TaxID=2751250 RepID=UPI001F0AFFB6|nr:CRISPR-associated endonuclease Cas2 [Exiguobacterium algae]